MLDGLGRQDHHHTGGLLEPSSCPKTCCVTFSPNYRQLQGFIGRTRGKFLPCLRTGDSQAWSLWPELQAGTRAPGWPHSHTVLAALAPSFLGLLTCGLQGPLLRPPYEGGGKSLEARLATVTCTQSPSPLSRPRFTKLQKPLIQAPSQRDNSHWSIWPGPGHVPWVDMEWGASVYAVAVRDGNLTGPLVQGCCFISYSDPWQPGSPSSAQLSPGGKHWWYPWELGGCPCKGQERVAGPGALVLAWAGQREDNMDHHRQASRLGSGEGYSETLASPTFLINVIS